MLVKGINRRVVLVRLSDTKLFEQAIFFVRDDAGAQGGVSADEVLHEACRIADNYIRRGARRKKRLSLSLPAPVYAAAGAALTGAVWLATVLIH